MPLPLIPIAIGASGMGALWWYSSGDEDEEPNFTKEFLNTLWPIIVIAIIVILLRWGWKKGSKDSASKKNTS